MAQNSHSMDQHAAHSNSAQRRRALADLQYNVILANEHGASSDDEDAGSHEYDEADVRPAIGVSMGREQTRLNSPVTPAVEKAAALDNAGGFFGSGLDGTSPELVDVVEDDPEDGSLNAENTAPVDDVFTDVERTSSPKSSSPLRTTSPWWAGNVRHQGTSGDKSSFRDGSLFSRPRATSQPESRLESWHKSIIASLPTRPKRLSLLVPPRKSEPVTALDPQTVASKEQRPNEAATVDGRAQILLSEDAEPVALEEAQATIGDLSPDIRLLKSARGKPPLLRRASSDTSLRQTFSRASSFGDDDRFADINAQVNSRFKAIKDSFHDSRLNFSVSNLTPDFLRDRGSSISQKQKALDDEEGKLPHGNDVSAGKYANAVDPMTRQPWPSAKAAFQDGPLDKSSTEHPNFSKALGQLEGDVVILGGYRGSILRSAVPPHKQLWVPIKVGLNLRKVDLEVGIDEDADERAVEKVIPSGMLKHIGPVNISRRLFKRLRTCENARSGKLRVHDYGYDWRLHPTHLSKQLIMFIESLSSNRPGVSRDKAGATVIAHSLGGLITRHAVNQRPELFKGVIYAGTPTTCVNILGPLRNGDEVLLSDKVLTAQVNFTIRTSFALLPLSGRCFIDKTTKEEYPVDFFDPQTWIDYRLSPCVARPLPPLATAPTKTGITSYVSSVTSSLPSLSLPNIRNNLVRSVKRAPNNETSKATTGDTVAEPNMSDSSAQSSETVLKHGNVDSSISDADVAPSARTAVTIPREDAIAYLTRTLATVKKFKQELAFVPSHQAGNKYPPVSVIFGKTTPTVFGARVDGREGIKHADAYDDLAFASGDGVVLARAAMVPEGYRAAKGGVVSSDRGHVTLLGDLEAVGRCLNAIITARERGVGLGKG